MKNRSGLVPTVITNKNGVRTTVHRKPDAAATRKHAPVPTVSDADSRVHLLKKALIKRTEDAIDGWSWENKQRRKLIKDAADIRNIVMLERIDRYFAYSTSSFTAAYNAIGCAGLDHTDDTLFKRVIEFTHLTEDSSPADDLIAELIPVFQQRPDHIERLAHCMHLATELVDRAEHGEGEFVTAGMVMALFNTPPAPACVSAPAVLKHAHSNTPVSDRKLLSKALLDREYRSYESFGTFSESSAALVANAIRDGVLDPRFSRWIHAESSERSAVEYTALLYSVDGLIDGHRGTNRALVVNAFETLYLIAGSEELPMDTDEEFAAQSALLRFMLTVENPNTEVISLNGVATFKFKYPEWVALLSRRSAVAETEALVAFYNERGIDAEAAEAYLDENKNPAVREGWL